MILFFGAGCTMIVGSPEKAFQKGKELVKEGKYQKAYKYFLAATKKQPENPIYQWAAAQTARNQNAAFIHTELAWKSGMKSLPVLEALMSLSVFINDQQRINKMLSLYNELNDSLKTPMLKADLFSQFGASDSALAIWKSMYDANPTPVLAFKIGREYSKQNDNQKGRDFLEEARSRKILDGAGYVLLASLRAYDYDYKGVDELFKETRQNGLYSNDVALEEAAFFFVSNKFDSAAVILDGYKAPVSDQPDQIINHRARINLAFIYAFRNEPDSIATLAALIPAKSPFKKGEQEFYNLLKQPEKIDTTTLIAKLDSIRRELPPNPFIELFTARALLKTGRNTTAVEVYRRLPDIYLRSPGILTEFAMALSRSGKDNEALIAISMMHRKKVFTRGSLELFRDLTFKKNMLEKSEQTQHVLEKLYGNDARLRFNGAIIALKTGKVDSAINLLTQLEKQFPKEYRFRTARISALMIKGDYINALELCRSGDIPKELTIPLEAQILAKQGKDAEALNILNKAVKENRNPGLLMEYAELLISMNHNSDAVKIYEELLKEGDREKKTDPQTAALYNNMAWAMLHSENPDKKLTLKAAAKAYELLPSLPNIMDTYAEVLITFGEYPECIKLLESNPATQKEPRLTFQLAVAYEKNNDINKAVRNLKTVATLMGSNSGTIKMDLDKAGVEKYIDKLMARQK